MSWKSQMEKARRRKPTEISLQVCVDDAASEAYYVAEAEADRLRKVAGAALTLAVARGQREEPKTPQDVEAIIEADPDVVAAVEAANAARATMDEAMLTFTFRSLVPDAFDDLVSAHPPRDDHEDDKVLGYNLDTFRPALVAACHVHYEPGDDGALVEQDGMTEQDAHDLFHSGGWNAGDLDRLFGTAWAVNKTSRMEYASLGKG